MEKLYNSALVMLLLVGFGCNNLSQTNNSSSTEEVKTNEQATIFAQIGYERSLNNDYTGAIESYSTAIKYNPRLTEAYLNRGDAKFKLNDKRGAILDFNKVIELDPNSQLGYYNRGLARILIGEKESGCLDLSKAGELGFSKAY